MAKKSSPVDDAPVDDAPVETPAEETTEPEVELDHPTDVQGDLVDNPVLEEEVEEETPDDVTEDEAEEAETTEEAPAEEETGEEPAAEVLAPPAEDVEPETPLPTDPGEFALKGDYSFEITTTDGKTLKITTPEQADEFAAKLDDNPELINASQYTKFNRGVVKMDVGIEREQASFEADKQTFEVAKAQQETREQQLNQWSNEVNYLRAKGDLPPITPELNNANWTDPENSKQAPIAETMAIFDWMTKENQARQAAGIPEVTSAVDAFRMMKAEERETGLANERITETKSRQAKGARVSGNAPYTPPAGTPKNSIVGEGGNLNDLVSEFSMNM